jgi:flagellar hook-length control protein FliK
MNIQTQSATAFAFGMAGAAAGANGLTGGTPESGEGKAEWSGFAALLQQFQSGQDASSDGLAAGLAGLFLLIAPPQISAAQTAESSQDAPSFAGAVIQTLMNDDRLLRQMMQDPKFGLWLADAAALLAAEQRLGSAAGGEFAPLFVQMQTQSSGLSSDATAHVLQSGPANADGPADESQLLLTRAQARAVLAAFAEALQQRPDSATVTELAQSFRETIESVIGDEIRTIAEKNVSDAAPLKELGGRSANGNDVAAARQNPLAILTQNDDLPPRQGTAGGSASGKVSGAQRAQAQLQILAAKAPIFPLGESPEVHVPQAETAAPEQKPHALPMGVVPVRELLQSEPIAPHAASSVGHERMDAQTFAQDMSRFVFKNLKLIVSNELSEAKISLHPQHLGHVDVKLTLHNGVLTAQFTAETLLGKEMLENQLPLLRAALQSQGLQVDKLVVNQNNSLPSGFFHEQRQQASQQFSQQHKQRQQQIAYDAVDGDFTQELTTIAALRSGLYGNLFETTA